MKTFEEIVLEAAILPYLAQTINEKIGPGQYLDRLSHEERESLKNLTSENMLKPNRQLLVYGKQVKCQNCPCDAKDRNCAFYDRWKNPIVGRDRPKFSVFSFHIKK